MKPLRRWTYRQFHHVHVFGFVSPVSSGNSLWDECKERGKGPSELILGIRTLSFLPVNVSAMLSSLDFVS